MPVTPFHMGPGLALKAAIGPAMSLFAFGVAQVAMDIEPLLGLIYGWQELHSRTHNLPVATLLGGITVLVSRPLLHVAYALGRFVGRWSPTIATAFGRGWVEPQTRSWRPLVIGAFVGTWSHVGLDALMHLDVWPLGPWLRVNPLLDLVSLRALHVGCMVAGVLGATGWWARRALAVERRSAITSP